MVVVKNNVEIKEIHVASLSVNVMDTMNMYGQTTVSYGRSYDFPPNTFAISFEDIVQKKYKYIDDRNLMFCRFLNFCSSYIEKFQISNGNQL